MSKENGSDKKTYTEYHKIFMRTGKREENFSELFALSLIERKNNLSQLNEEEDTFLLRKFSETESFYLKNIDKISACIEDCIHDFSFTDEEIVKESGIVAREISERLKKRALFHIILQTLETYYVGLTLQTVESIKEREQPLVQKEPKTKKYKHVWTVTVENKQKNNN